MVAKNLLPAHSHPLFLIAHWGVLVKIYTTFLPVVILKNKCIVLASLSGEYEKKNTKMTRTKAVFSSSKFIKSFAMFRLAKVFLI
jgi:hypothetical protein